MEQESSELSAVFIRAAPSQIEFDDLKDDPNKDIEQLISAAAAESFSGLDKFRSKDEPENMEQILERSFDRMRSLSLKEIDWTRDVVPEKPQTSGASTTSGEDDCADGRKKSSDLEAKESQYSSSDGGDSRDVRRRGKKSVESLTSIFGKNLVSSDSAAKVTSLHKLFKRMKNDCNVYTQILFTKSLATEMNSKGDVIRVKEFLKYLNSINEKESQTSCKCVSPESPDSFCLLWVINKFVDSRGHAALIHILRKTHDLVLQLWLLRLAIRICGLANLALQCHGHSTKATTKSFESSFYGITMKLATSFESGAASTDFIEGFRFYLSALQTLSPSNLIPAAATYVLFEILVGQIRTIFDDEADHDGTLFRSFLFSQDIKDPTVLPLIADALLLSHAEVRSEAFKILSVLMLSNPANAKTILTQKNWKHFATVLMKCQAAEEKTEEQTVRSRSKVGIRSESSSDGLRIEIEVPDLEAFTLEVSLIAVLTMNMMELEVTRGKVRHHLNDTLNLIKDLHSSAPDADDVIRVTLVSIIHRMNTKPIRSFQNPVSTAWENLLIFFDCIVDSVMHFPLLDEELSMKTLDITIYLNNALEVPDILLLESVQKFMISALDSSHFHSQTYMDPDMRKAVELQRDRITKRLELIQMILRFLSYCTNSSITTIISIESEPLSSHMKVLASKLKKHVTKRAKTLLIAPALASKIHGYLKTFAEHMLTFKNLKSKKSLLLTQRKILKRKTIRIAISSSDEPSVTKSTTRESSKKLMAVESGIDEDDSDSEREVELLLSTLAPSMTKTFSQGAPLASP